MNNEMTEPAGNTGHGHVFERPDGQRARCGGPGICQECSRDFASRRQENQDSLVTPEKISNEALYADVSEARKSVEAAEAQLEKAKKIYVEKCKKLFRRVLS